MQSIQAYVLKSRRICVQSNIYKYKQCCFGEEIPIDEIQYSEFSNGWYLWPSALEIERKNVIELVFFFKIAMHMQQERMQIIFKTMETIKHFSTENSIIFTAK